MPISFLKRLLKRLLKRRPISRRNETKLGKKGGTEAVDTLKEAYGESAIKPVTICKRMKRFQEEERERAKDEARKSRPPLALIAEQRSGMVLGIFSIRKNYSKMQKLAEAILRTF